MQHARVYRAWLPPEIFPKYGNVVEREEKIVNSCNREKNLYFYITHLHSLARDYSFSV